MARPRLLWLCTICLMCSLPAHATVEIYVSIAPLKYFVERIGGEHVHAQVMVAAGHNPVTYEPTPRQMVAVASAQLYVRIGVPFESVWMARIQAAHPELDVVDARDGMDLAPLPYQALQLGDHAGHNHSHEAGDPHVWLDPTLAKVIATNIRDGLKRADRINAKTYERNTERFLVELQQLDAEVRRLTESSQNVTFLVFHPAWSYFARAYGLEQLSVEYEGKEPGPAALSRLIEIVKRENINTIFVQKQFSARVATTLAEEIEGDVVVLDPLAEDYVENLLRAAKAISDSRKS